MGFFLRDSQVYVNVNVMDKTYSIQALTKEFEITARSIRFYEEKGLLNPTRQGTSRIFSAADRTRLKLILRGKRLGLSLEESRDIIDLYNPTSGNNEQTHKLLAAIDKRITALQSQRDEIDAMLIDLAATKALVAKDNN